MKVLGGVEGNAYFFIAQRVPSPNSRFYKLWALSGPTLWVGPCPNLTHDLCKFYGGYAHRMLPLKILSRSGPWPFPPVKS